MPAAGYAYASYTKALEFRNGKSFWRVTEEGYALAENHLMIAVMNCSFIAKSQKTTLGLDHFYHVLA
ncbi:hypothetical protein [Nostoc sp.]|uniref:hypothetical protein n=1 Tax=Nostoc sp. TaxID=1180 RepID=UPI002FF52AA6